MTTTTTAAPPPMIAAPAIGWRDEAIEDGCVRCEGWGTVRYWTRIPAPETRDGYRLEPKPLETCPRCLGTGRRRR